MPNPADSVWWGTHYELRFWNPNLLRLFENAVARFTVLPLCHCAADEVSGSSPCGRSVARKLQLSPSSIGESEKTTATSVASDIGEAGVLTMGSAVIKPFESLPGSP